MEQVRSSSGSSWPVWVTILDVLVASGFSLAGLIHPGAVLPASAEPTVGSAIFALYAAARTIPLALAVLAAAYRSETRILVALGLLAGVVQSLDGLIGIAQHDPGKTIGPFVLAALQFRAARVLSRRLPAAVQAVR